MHHCKIRFICHLCLLFLLPISAHSKTFTLNTFSDEADESLNDKLCLSTEGNCSLRAAIQEANASAGSHTIVLKSGTYYLTLAGRDENESASGDLDIKADISIEGAGAVNTIINADSPDDELPPEGIDRVFDINGATVTFKNLSITRGEILTKETSTNRGGIGGGIRVLNANLNLDNVWVYGNTAGAGLGGGIFSINSTVNIQHSVIHLNYAAAGAGLALLNSTTSVNDSFFRGVTGAKNESYLGAGIYNSGDLAITKSVFSNHSVRVDGGAIYHEQGKLRITNSTFNSNRAERNGGAIYYRAGEILTSDENTNNKAAPVLINVTVTYNHAYNLGYSYPGIDYMSNQLRSLDLTQFESMDADGNVLFFSDTPVDNPIVDVKSAIGGGGIVVAGLGNNPNQKNVFLRMSNSIFANNTYDINNLVADDYVRAETLFGDCITKTPSQIVSLGGNAATSDSCDFTHTSDLGTLQPGDFKLGPMSSDGKIFSDDTDYLPLKTQNEFNALKPQVQLYAKDSPILGAAIAAYCPGDDQLGKPRTSCDTGAYEYSPPQARPLHYITTPGETITGMFAIAGPEFQEATYQIITEPDLSIGVLFHPDTSSPNWNFATYSTATGNTEVVYKICSQLISECSKEATIRFKIINNTTDTVTISVESPTGNPTTSSVHIIDEADLIAGAADEDYSFPFGAMYFNIEDVPATGPVTVKLQLPLDTSLAKDIIDKVTIRKLNTSGQWVNLPTEIEPGQSSGEYDHTTKIITLILSDGDTFDLNPDTGAIRGPVALAVPLAKNTDDSLQFTGAGASLYLLIYLLFFVFLTLARNKPLRHSQH